MDCDDEILIIYKELLKDFNEFNDNTLKGLVKLKNSMKKLEKNIIKTSTKNPKNKKKNDWGIAEQRNVPKSIEIFFNLESGTKYSRNQIGGLFQDYIAKNNLKGNLNAKNKIDNRIYKLDDKLTKLFKLSNDEKNKINSCLSSSVKYPNAFNFYNYQTWIKKIYIEELSNVLIQDNK